MNDTYKIVAIILFLIINVRTINAEPVQEELNNSIGGIDYNIFYRSVPEQMRIGESHTVKVFLRNNGEIRNKFRVVFRTTESSMPSSFNGAGYKEYVYPHFATTLSVLDPGETSRKEFNIAPVKPYLGRLEISADLYVMRPGKNKLTSEFVLVDHVSKPIRVIKPAFERDELAFYLIILSIFVSIILIIINRRKAG